MDDGDERDLVTFEASDEFLALLHQCLHLVLPSPASLATASASTSVSAPRDGTTTAGPKNDGNDRPYHGSGSSSIQAETTKVLTQMRTMLEPYAESNQTYLLDPYLELMIAPVSQALRACVRSVHSTLSSTVQPSKLFALDTLGQIFYLYARIRGHKTVIHFFPHEVDDLQPLVQVLEASLELGLKLGWHVRYTLLLWLSLVCMIPFDLRQFDQGGQSTIDRLASLARAYVGVTGIEREACAVLIGRLYQRPETEQALRSFLCWSATVLGPEQQGSIYVQTGVVFSLCDLLKVLDPTRVASLGPQFEQILTAIASSRQAQLDAQLQSGNAQLGRAYTKLIGRLALKSLPPRPRRKRHVRAIGGAAIGSTVPWSVQDDGGDVPEQVEDYLGELLESLSHENSQVRYSAAKGVARISERLPDSFVAQVLESILGLFEDNSLRLPDGNIDLNAASEASWHGACLALAEMARRDLLNATRMGTEDTEDKAQQAVQWVQHALTFDVRRGGRGVGTSVRDAACYVLWALARAHDVRSLSPHCTSPQGIAAALVCVAVTDREVSIRRAASAAYQEAAGRLALFPHGLDVIRIADFMAVSVRRHCFLRTVPSVANYEPYRTALVSHLQGTTLAHWDPAMRELGAQSLALIIQIDPTLLESTMDTAKAKTSDPLLQHGRLLALAALTPLAREHSVHVGGNIDVVLRVERLLNSSTTGKQMYESVCRLLAITLDGEVYCALAEEQNRSVTDLVVRALSRPEAQLQWAAVEAIRALTTAVITAGGGAPEEENKGTGSAYALFTQVQQTWVSMAPVEQEGWAKALGALKFGSDEYLDVVRFLVQVLDSTSAQYSSVVEARRDACGSLVNVLATNASHGHVIIPTSVVNSMLDTLLRCTNDYTTDRRGDVGSWVRSASMAAMGKLYNFLTSRFEPAEPAEPEEANQVILARVTIVEGTMLRQMGARNDGVRSQAARALVDVVQSVQRWDWSTDRTSDPLATLVQEVEAARVEMSEPAWLFPKMVTLLADPALGHDVLQGLLISVGMDKEYYNNEAIRSIQSWIQSPDHPEESASKLRTALSLVGIATKANLSQNKVVVPALRLSSSLLLTTTLGPNEWEDLADLLEQVSSTALRALTKVRNVMRLDASRDFCLALLLRLSHTKTTFRKLLVRHLRWFLSHSDASLRTSTSERLVLSLDELLDVQLDLVERLGTQDDEQVERVEQARDACEELLLSTTWTSLPDAQEAAMQVQDHLGRMLTIGSDAQTH